MLPADSPSSASIGVTVARGGIASAGVGISSVEDSVDESFEAPDEADPLGRDTGSCGASASMLASCGTLVTAERVGPLSDVVDVVAGAGLGSRADGVLVVVGSDGVAACPVVSDAPVGLVPPAVGAAGVVLAEGPGCATVDGEGTAAPAVEAFFADEVVAVLGVDAGLPVDDGVGADGLDGSTAFD